MHGPMVGSRPWNGVQLPMLTDTKIDFLDVTAAHVCPKNVLTPTESIACTHTLHERSTILLTDIDNVLRMGAAPDRRRPDFVRIDSFDGESPTRVWAYSR